MARSVTQKGVLSVKSLRSPCDGKKLGFKITSELAPLVEFIDQDRAISALRLGITHTSDGFNVIVVNPQGAGKNSVLNRFIRDIVQDHEKRDIPPDLCYVLNFEDAQKPRLLMFLAGEGKKFQEELMDLGLALFKEIPEALQDSAVLGEQNAFNQRLIEFEETLREEFKSQFVAFGAEIKVLQISPLMPPTVAIVCKEAMPNGAMEERELHQWATREGLSKNEEKKRRDAEEKMQSAFRELNQRHTKKQRELERELEGFRRNYVLELFDEHAGPLRERFCNGNGVSTYFDGLRKFIGYSYAAFGSFNQSMPDSKDENVLANGQNGLVLPFQVNLLVDNSCLDRPPVVEDFDASFSSLFGKIAAAQRGNAMALDHTKIVSGTLARANGGVLILDAEQLLNQNFEIWRKLVSVLKRKELQFEDFGQRLGIPAAITLDPEPIPVNLKIVLIATARLYWLIVQHPESLVSKDIEHLFRVPAIFKDLADRTPEHERKYAEFVAFCVEREGVLPFSRGAVAKVIEHGSRLVDHQHKLSLKMTKIKDLVLEASWIAGRVPKARRVEARDVTQALENKVFRIDLIRERVQDMYAEGMILFSPEGSESGRVYGLAVHVFGELKFGIPARITAQPYISKKGEALFSVDRAAELSGHIFDKGFEIASAYLRARYAKNDPFSRTISIAFEQTYSGVDGDSATASTLFVTLSALSGIPLRQDIAITGSANQFGEIQPVGGVNEKIEGFFDVCTATCGVEGKGVAIPVQNVQNLMLREDVVRAVRQKKFHVYAINTVEEGIELLTGKSMKEIDEAIVKNIKTPKKKEHK